MNNRKIVEAFLLGAFFCAGMLLLGHLLSTGAFRIKGLDRTVTVKGLSEREVAADVAIWPIRFSEAENDLGRLYGLMERHTDSIVAFLRASGFSDDEISVSPPAIIDRQAQGYLDANKVKFRFAATGALTVYTSRVDAARKAMTRLIDLGKQGIVIGAQEYEAKTEYLFTRLNDIKPEMVEEATRSAREVAEKFAKDSNSRLGKIKTAQQGQFTITDRDSNTPYIKKVRVVSTLEYYLSD